MSRLIVSLVLIALLCGCDMQPKGTTVLKFESKKEFDRVQVTRADPGQAYAPIKFKYIDTNTFITTAPLSPGRYKVSARGFEGVYLAREITVDPKTKRYVISDEKGGPVEQAARAHKISAELAKGSAVQGDIVVIFIGDDATMRRTRPENGRITVDGPPPGIYRVEIFAPGTPLRSWSRDKVDIKGPIDFGLIDLR